MRPLRNLKRPLVFSAVDGALRGRDDKFDLFHIRQGNELLDRDLSSKNISLLAHDLKAGLTEFLHQSSSWFCGKRYLDPGFSVLHKLHLVRGGARFLFEAVNHG